MPSDVEAAWDDSDRIGADRPGARRVDVGDEVQRSGLLRHAHAEGAWLAEGGGVHEADVAVLVREQVHPQLALLLALDRDGAGEGDAFALLEVEADVLSDIVLCRRAAAQLNGSLGVRREAGDR